MILLDLQELFINLSNENELEWSIIRVAASDCDITW